MKTFLTSAFLFFATSLTLSAQYRSEVWMADKGNGYYRNPVIHADYSDPDVCAVGDDYYMTASSFQCVPGLPILHSKDLVNWEITNYALPRLEPETFFDKVQHGKGVWAPCIRHHDGWFYIYWGDPDFGIYMVRTRDINGSWEKPILVKPGKGLIDPTPLWDDDGNVYLVNAWAGSRSGMNSVLTVSRMNKEGTAVISSPVMIYDGNDGNDGTNHTVEGPKIYKKDGFYYIFAPAGGVVHGWQIVLRSKNIYGPYEVRKVMEQGHTDINGPHQGAWVETPYGESWFVHFQDKGLYGRVIHLNPMAWKDGWPVIGTDPDGNGCGEPVKSYRKPKAVASWPMMSPAESDEFNTTTLGKQWEWHSNYHDTFGFPTGLGFFRIYGQALPDSASNCWPLTGLLLQKFPAEEFTATTKLNVSAKGEGQESGLIVMGYDYCRLSVMKKGNGFVLNQAVCKDADKGNKESTETCATLRPTRTFNAGALDNYEIEIYLRVHVGKGGVCSFSYSTDGKTFKNAGRSFTARQGRWIGAKVGLFSLTPDAHNRGWADADWFRITK